MFRKVKIFKQKQFWNQKGKPQPMAHGTTFQPTYDTIGNPLTPDLCIGIGCVPIPRPDFDIKTSARNSKGGARQEIFFLFTFTLNPLQKIYTKMGLFTKLQIFLAPFQHL